MRTTGDARAGALAGAVRRKRRGGAVTGSRLAGLPLVACLLLAAPAHAERRIVIIQNSVPEGPSLEMSAPMVAAAQAAAAKEAEDRGEG